MVRRIFVVGFIIGAILVIAGTVGVLNFDPFRDDVVPTSVPKPSGTIVPIVGGVTVEGVVIGDTIDFVRMTCPEGFTSGAINIETGLPICIQQTIEVITDPRTFECGENIQDDGMIIFVDCETIRIDTSLCEFISTDTIEFGFSGRIETSTTNNYQCSDNICLQERSSIFIEGITANECP